MKKSILVNLICLLILMSCGKQGQDNDFDIVDIRQVWTARDDSQVQIDLRDLSNITIYDMEKDGVTSDCTYSSPSIEPSLLVGKLELTLIGGDPAICEVFDRKVNYYAFRDNEKKSTILNFGVSEKMYYFKL